MIDFFASVLVSFMESVSLEVLTPPLWKFFFLSFFSQWCWELNVGPYACWESTLLLSYIPVLEWLLDLAFTESYIPNLPPHPLIWGIAEEKEFKAEQAASSRSKPAFFLSLYISFQATSLLIGATHSWHGASIIHTLNPSISHP